MLLSDSWILFGVRIWLIFAGYFKIANVSIKNYQQQIVSICFSQKRAQLPLQKFINNCDSHYENKAEICSKSTNKFCTCNLIPMGLVTSVVIIVFVLNLLLNFSNL